MGKENLSNIKPHFDLNYYVTRELLAVNSTFKKELAVQFCGNQKKMKEVYEMTFHTFEASSILTGNKFRKINKKFKEYGSAYFNDRHTEGRKILTGLKHKGIIIYVYRRNTVAERFVYHIVYKINPTRIKDSDDYLNLMHSNDVDEIFDIVNSTLFSVSTDLPAIQECTLTRFDFCSNIVLQSKKAVEDFIALLNQAYIPNKEYTQKINYDSRSGRYVIPKEEATFTKNDYCEISFYNKIKQLESEKLKIKWHRNILRFEIRCFKNFIISLNRKFHIKTIEDFFYSLPEIGTYVFESRFAKIGIQGSFFKLSEIKEIVSQTQLKQKTKSDMIEFSVNAAKHKGIQNSVIAELIENPLKIVKRFSEIGICAMPLPYRSDIKSGTNLLDLCLQFADAKYV